MALTGLNAEMLKRNRPMQITPIQAPRGVAPKDDPSALQRASKIALDRGMDTVADEGGKMAMKYGKPLFEKGMSALMPSAAPIAQAGTGMSPQMASAILGSGSASAPLVAAQAGAPMTAAMKGGVAALAPTAAGAAGTGTMAAMMASPLAPIALGLLAGKAFKLFSNGGQVGPLSAAQYKEEGGQIEEEKDTGTKILEEIKEQLRRKEQAKEDNFLLPSLRSMGGPVYAADGNLKNVNEAVQKNIDRLKFRGLGKALNEKSDSYVRRNQGREGYSESDFKYPQNDRRKMGEMINELNLYGGGIANPLAKVEYKSAGGETYKLSYGGGPLSKGA